MVAEPMMVPVSLARAEDADAAAGEVPGGIVEIRRPFAMADSPEAPASTELPEPLPSEFGLGTLGSLAVRVRESIDVSVSTENDDFIAYAHELNEFGFGKNQTEALKDLQRAVLQLFSSLEADEERLGPDLTQTLGVLRQKLQRIQ